MTLISTLSVCLSSCSDSIEEIEQKMFNAAERLKYIHEPYDLFLNSDTLCIELQEGRKGIFGRTKLEGETLERYLRAQAYYMETFNNRYKELCGTDCGWVDPYDPFGMIRQ